MRVFVISLDRAVERRAAVTRRLRSCGVEPEFVPAVDGRCLSDFEARQRGYRASRFRQPLQASEIGCVLSHFRALRLFLKTGEESCVILEDDAEIASNFVEQVRRLESGISGWDLIKLENRPGTVKGPVVAHVEGMDVFVSLRPGFGATGFVYSRLGARKVLDSWEAAFSRPYDTLLSQAWKKRLCILQVFPALAWEDGGESMMDGRVPRTSGPPGVAGLMRGMDRLTDSLGKRVHAWLVSRWKVHVLPAYLP
ncbi:MULTISPECIES: glycosyltransferase family 25 protein [unclassified Thioalkalivibrio]|uniref:glycosyltransferase family 25 protein n=1 Tax=unclassified Thioalkalivibrio TaxID=2621013 RepID=UPI000475662A|nr:MULTISPECIES: glycosyltransferase family 25 protein [unclassified Thioalkalivibrio]